MESTVEASRAALEGLGAKDVPDGLLATYPRTPLYLRVLLSKLQQGNVMAEKFVEEEIEYTVDRVRAMFSSCKDPKSVLADAAKPTGKVEWFDLKAKCGEKFNPQDFERSVADEKKLFRRVKGGVSAQFDQNREAFRRYAATL